MYAFRVFTFLLDTGSITVLLCSLMVSGCIPHKVQTKPKPQVELPKSFAEQLEGKTGGAVDRFWYAFNDQDLTQLIRHALENNLDMRAAWARIEQADALRKVARSGFFPTVDADLSASRQKIQTLFGGFQNNLYSASLAASYELDLFGKVRARNRAAGLDLDATRDDLEVMALSLASEVAERWFDLINARARRKILEEQVSTNEAYLKLVKFRFEQGINSAVDVHQQRQQTARARSELALVGADEKAAANEIAVLMGLVPSGADIDKGRERGRLSQRQKHAQRALLGSEKTDLPPLPPFPQKGVPSDLLTRRPDVRAAQKRAEAADYRVGAAIADRFPSLRLTGSLGFSSTDLQDLLSNFVWSVLGGLSAPVIDGGRRKAEVQRSRAVLKERMSNYGQTVLRAMLEVENALVREKHLRENLDLLRKENTIAKELLRATRLRYQGGLSDYLPVLNALRTQQALELGVQTAERGILSTRIQLYRALGGDWTTKLRKPADPPKSAPSEKNS